MAQKWLEHFFEKVLVQRSRTVLTLNLDPHDQDTIETESIIHSFRTYYPNALLFSDDPLLQTQYQAEALKATRHFLGATTEAVLLDIRRGFPLDYFLSIAATIGTRGVLLLLATMPLGEQESQRFHDIAISTPYFDHYLARQLSYYSYCYRQGKLYTPQFQQDEDALKEKLVAIKRETVALSKNKKERLNQAQFTEEQRRIYNHFLTEESGVFTLFSPRGSGKSALGAALIASNPKQFILTAPNQLAIEQYQSLTDCQFRAPDALFLGIEEGVVLAQTLIIEEAAKMPLSHLERLVKRFRKVLMISSVENYEGTGQGLREKLYDLISIKKQYSLKVIHRFDKSDPLARLVGALRFTQSSRYDLDVSLPVPTKEALQEALVIELYDDRNIAQLREDSEKLLALYQLLNQTHYQTNIQDIRRLFDAPNQLFVLAFYRSKLIGATWGIREGELPTALAETVFRGERRPKGNLVPQILAGQSYFPEAMAARSVRISRISVATPFRRLRVGEEMISAIEAERSLALDFLSVSFGLTADLLAFWKSLGFQPAHLGSHLDKTTGLYSLVVLKKIQDHPWIEESYRKFAADAVLNIKKMGERPAIAEILTLYAKAGSFDARDAAVIDAYSYGKRARYSVENALYRAKKEGLADRLESEGE